MEGGARYILELGCEEKIAPGHARGLDSVADLLLVAVGGRGVNVAITGLQSNLDSRLDFVGLGLPCSKANGRDFRPRVEGVGLAAEVVSVWLRDIVKNKGTNVVFLTAAMMILDIGTLNIR